MLTELSLYPLQWGDTPLHLATEKGHTTCVEYLFSAPGINLNIKNRVSWFAECCCISLCIATNLELILYAVIYHCICNLITFRFSACRYIDCQKHLFKIIAWAPPSLFHYMYIILATVKLFSSCSYVLELILSKTL